MTDSSPQGNDANEPEVPPEELVDQATLIEDVSIDGMCGVY
ncbi:mycofactocin precursor MftA [Sciscionella sediminilitoris]|nr:mycofactocin precursor MftA [Sciscionella sp. SE31]